ncbi:unnamed protein product, partial [Brachionus calyciflorus]
MSQCLETDFELTSFMIEFERKQLVEEDRRLEEEEMQRRQQEHEVQVQVS